MTTLDLKRVVICIKTTQTVANTMLRISYLSHITNYGVALVIPKHNCNVIEMVFSIFLYYNTYRKAISNLLYFGHEDIVEARINSHNPEANTENQFRIVVKIKNNRKD